MSFFKCGSLAKRRYRIRSLVAAALCVLFTLLAVTAFRHTHPAPGVAYVLAVLPALPILGALVATGLYLGEERDEFQRNVLVQSLLIGIGGTLATSTVWGFLEDFGHAPHLDPIWIFSLFWLFAGLSLPVVKMRYR